MARLRNDLDKSWGIRALSIEYVPEGGGSHHWKVTDQAGTHHFVTVDDLDHKDWLGGSRESVWNGLRRALGTADALHRFAQLDFVVGPSITNDGEVVVRLDDRYTASVYPFLVDRSYPFGPYTQEALRQNAVDLIAQLHFSTSAVRDGALHHELGYGGRSDLEAFLAAPDRPWTGGPFSEPARQLLLPHVAELIELVGGFERLADDTGEARADPVITHGEPHPANLMTVDGHVDLIDWDTCALGPPERDLWPIAVTPGKETERYERMTGRSIDFAVVRLYQLRWYLDDIGSAVRLFHRSHVDDPDTRAWWQGLGPRLELLPKCVDLVS